MDPRIEKVIVQVAPDSAVTIPLSEYRELIHKSALYETASAIYDRCSYPNEELQTVLNCKKASESKDA